MPIHCPKCGLAYDAKLFWPDLVVTCECGEKISLQDLWAFEDIMKDLEDRKRAEEIRRAADHICKQILSADVQDVDIEIAKSKLRILCEKYFPKKMHLYDMIYESRFRRLWEQFRKK